MSRMRIYVTLDSTKGFSITALMKDIGILKEQISLQLCVAGEGITLNANLKSFNAGIPFLLLLLYPPSSFFFSDYMRIRETVSP